jgi:hypothetical protein
LSGAAFEYVLPGGGRGFTRPASLVSLWSTAPFLQNNSVGPFNPSPSLETRMQVFTRSIEQMLWPERRDVDPLFTRLNITGPGVGIIQRTSEDSFIYVPRGFIPDGLSPLLGAGARLFPMFFRNGEVNIGPIPKGTPVSLFTSMDFTGNDLPEPQRKEQKKKLLALFQQITRELKRGTDIFSDRNIMESMLQMSKCPDLVINKGHYFGTSYFPEEPGLSDTQKTDLIAFLKRL